MSYIVKHKLLSYNNFPCKFFLFSPQCLGTWAVRLIFHISPDIPGLRRSPPSNKTLSPQPLLVPLQTIWSTLSCASPPLRGTGRKYASRKLTCGVVLVCEESRLGFSDCSRMPVGGTRCSSTCHSDSTDQGWYIETTGCLCSIGFHFTCQKAKEAFAAYTVSHKKCVSHTTVSELHVDALRSQSHFQVAEIHNWVAVLLLQPVSEQTSAGRKWYTCLQKTNHRATSLTFSEVRFPD